MKRLLVTGAAGFIGSALCRLIAAEGRDLVVCLDNLGYAASPEAIAEVRRAGAPLEVVDVADAAGITAVFARHRPDAVLHLAAETHVDRSIDGPAAFVQTNVVGTQVLLEAARHHWLSLPPAARAEFRFLHVSTDEVFGALGEEGSFTEESAYRPTSPYAASKACADHLVRAWHATYGLPILISNCSNNYGPWQFPEKLIPLMIVNALEGLPLPVYGTGRNVRDWLFVDDHARALLTILRHGRPGESYNVGGSAELRNIEVVRTVCAVLDSVRPKCQGSHAELIRFVADRPAHDHRYAIDAGKLRRELSWTPAVDFAQGIRATVDWYLENEAWWRPIRAGRYDGRRLGRPAADRAREESAAS